MPEVEPTETPDDGPMTILLFIDGLGSGGAQRQFSYLARGLAARGHAVTVAVYNNQDHFAREIEEAGVSIVRLLKPSRFSPRPIFAFAKLYRRCRADVAIAFLRSPAVKAELARVLCPRMKVLAAERTAYTQLPLPLTLRLTQKLHSLAHFVTVNSKNQERAMKREFPALAKRIVTIRNGADLPQKVSTAAGKPDRELRLVAVSSLMPYKNSLRLAEAVASLRDEHNLRVTVSWVGETFESLGDSGTYRETCERIAALKLEDQWHWLGVRSDVSVILADHDALIHPSLHEGTSNAVCEAMAIGLPVLAGRIADHEEMIASADAGILFDPADARSIAEAIARFAATDRRRRCEMGSNGRRLIETRYSFDRMVTQYEALARAAVRGRRDASRVLAIGDEGLRECAA